MSRVAVPEPGFQVPDTVGHVGRRDKDIGGRSSMGERFGSRLFAETLRKELGFTEPEITAAMDVLLEVAPLLVNKQVVSVDDTTMNPAKWHACAAFVASGLTHASALPGKAGNKTHGNNARERNLTATLRAFQVDCVEFFRSLRKFMSAAAEPLTKRLNDKKQVSQGRTRSPSKQGKSLVTKDDQADQAVGLENLEASLSVPELRTSFAFTRVAAQKYKLFADCHLDSSTAAGADVARFGWLLFLAAKHSTLPKFPDLFSLYHVLVSVEAFLLVNAPTSILRTELKNMVSVAAGAICDPNTGEHEIDVLQGLSASSKTKLPTLRAAMGDVERAIIAGSLGQKPCKKKVVGLAKGGPTLFPDVFGAGDAAAAAAATTAAKHAYTNASVNSGLAWHLRLDERLYFALGKEEEEEAQRVLGDVGATATMNGQGGVAATPRPGGQQGVPFTPWRGAGTMKFVLGASPARLGSKAAYSPYPASRLGGGVALASAEGPSVAPMKSPTTAGRVSVPFTPVSEAMASASWLHGIVAPTSPSGVVMPSPATRLERFLGKEASTKLVATVHGLAGKTSAALTEDAFLVTINGVAALQGASHNVSVDNLVRRRQEEAVRVFAYFAEGVFEAEHRREVGGGGDSLDSIQEGTEGTEGEQGEKADTNPAAAAAAAGGVMDVASLAATVPTQVPRPLSLQNNADPSESQRAAYRQLAGSSRFVRAVLSCAMEVVVASYKTATLKFPAIPRLLGLDAFDVVHMIEPFVRADPTMPREVKKHFNAIEERVMETMAWQRGSSFFNFMRAAERGAPPPRPAQAALAAVSKPAPPAMDEKGNAEGLETDPEKEKETGKEKTAPNALAARRSPSFSSVAGVAAAAASGDVEVVDTAAHARSSSHTQSFDDDDNTPPRKNALAGDANATTNAFSTPLRGSTTPRERPARASQGAAASLSSAGGGSEPLPSRFARTPPSGALSEHTKTCRNSLRVFFAKVMRTSARRLADLCERLHLPQELTKSAYDLTSKVVYDHTKLLYNRHLDQILLCAVYGVCKVNAGRGMVLDGREPVTFRDIIACYHKQPQCREETFWTVSLEQSDPELEVARRGDVIQFYNQVFVPEVKTRLLQLKTEITNSQRGASGASPLQFAGPGGTNAGTQLGGTSPEPPGLRSPRRAVTSGNNTSTPRSVYVSPMRATASAATALSLMTPRSKSLFAFVGESMHAYHSPGRDLTFINRRVAAAAAAEHTQRDTRAEDTTATAVAAGVAGIAAAASDPPATKSPGHGRKSQRTLGFDFHPVGASRGGGEEDTPPAKAPRR